jgi:riboflavin kinase/FMN adenylyltransferase
VAEGRVEEASVLLGRAFSVEGTVVAGAARGHALGFATANIEIRNEILPADGVYAVFGRLGEATESAPDEGYRSGVSEWKLLPGVANLGFAPTFGRDRRTLEVHFLDIEGDRYGSYVEVLLLARLRGERKFPGPQALADQIRKDIEVARKVHTENEWRFRAE